MDQNQVNTIVSALWDVMNQNSQGSVNAADSSPTAALKSVSPVHSYNNFFSTVGGDLTPELFGDSTPVVDVASTLLTDMGTSPLDTCAPTPFNYDFLSFLSAESETGCTCTSSDPSLKECSLHPILPPICLNHSNLDTALFIPNTPFLKPCADNIRLPLSDGLFGSSQSYGQIQTQNRSHSKALCDLLLSPQASILMSPDSDLAHAATPSSSALSLSALDPSRDIFDCSSKAASASPSDSDLPVATDSVFKTEATDDVSDIYKYKADKHFLESLPPQLAMKRNRVRSSKHIETINMLARGEAADLDPSLNEGTFADGDSTSGANGGVSKRNKNTAAARRSRLRKALRMDTLEKQVVQLEVEKKSLLSTISGFRAEKSKYIEREELLLDHIRSMKMLLMSAIGNNGSSRLMQ